MLILKRAFNDKDFLTAPMGVIGKLCPRCPAHKGDVSTRSLMERQDAEAQT